MATQELPPPLALIRLATGFYVSSALYVVAKLGIADLIAQGPKDSVELAKASGTHAASLNRVLCLLVSVGVFTENAEGKFGLTPIGACLRSDTPGSVRSEAASRVRSRLIVSEFPWGTALPGCCRCYENVNSS